MAGVASAGVRECVGGDHHYLWQGKAATLTRLIYAGAPALLLGIQQALRLAKPPFRRATAN